MREEAFFDFYNIFNCTIKNYYRYPLRYRTESYDNSVLRTMLALSNYWKEL